MRRLALSLVTMALAVGTAGCEADEWVEFKVLTQLPPSSSVQSDAIQITAGWAVGVEAIPVRNNRRVDDLELDLVVDNVSVMGLDRGLEANHFVIWGAEPGSVLIDIYFGDELIGDMPATVLQP